MSLARAFTTRKVKLGHDQLGDLPKMPNRSHSVRDRGTPVMRHQISAPMQLVHTTNMLSYNAPDIHPLRSKPSIRSEVDSEAPSTTESTPPTSPEISPVDEVPGPVPNHLSTYFMVPEKALAMSKDAPPVPQRSPSHTKQNSYDAIARSRSMRQSKDSDNSVSTKASFTFSRTSSTSTRASTTSSNSAMHSQKEAAPPLPTAVPTQSQQRSRKESHPFGKELAQVTELAEEYGTRALTREEREDDQYIKANGLAKFSPSDYLDDVTSLISAFFPEVNHARSATPLWI